MKRKMIIRDGGVGIVFYATGKMKAKKRGESFPNPFIVFKVLHLFERFHHFD